MGPRPLTTACALAAALTASIAGAQPIPARSPRNANYDIDATLDTPARTLRAHERITWRNITSHPASELQFHLYWNAWTDTKSTWMRETARRHEVERPPAEFAQFTIESLKIAGGSSPAVAPQDLTPSQQYIAPDDGNADDRTVMRVPLAGAVAPGESIEIDVAWTARVPRTFDRTGTIGNYFFIAQWFPKLGVLEDSGWNCHQFHRSTEFFSDYGVYNVRLTVPAGWTVGATGTERTSTINPNGTATHEYVQEDVHDFAWTTSPDFVVRTARFDEAGLPPVDMRLLIQPEHLGQAGRHFDATRSVLRRYGAWFGPYPYGHITIVDPAFQSDTDGMEYPTLFTAGTHWLVSRRVTPSTPEETVVHEAGHQFWYGIVGTNEFEHAWMDEGINTYATARALAADYPDIVLDRYYFGDLLPWTFPEVRIRRDTDLNRVWSYRTGATEDTIARASYTQRPETVGRFAYDKPAVWLDMLERWLGWPALQQALAETFRQGAFGHPEPGVVLSNIQRAAGRDISGVLTETYETAAVFDYSVETLTSSEQDGQFATRVLVRRLRDGVFPVDVQITFDDGQQVTEHWDGVSEWREYSYVRPARARSAAVDPNRVLLLDVNYTNNSKTLAPRAGAAARKWTLKWMVWLQDALLTWGLFA